MPSSELSHSPPAQATTATAAPRSRPEPYSAAAEIGGMLAGRKVLIIVENLPTPFDRRVWQEARALRAAGMEVCIICPTGKGYEARYEHLEGIHIYRHPLPDEGDGPLGYLREYATALFWEFVLACKVRSEEAHV